MTPKVGQLLYRGCSCDEFARVVAVKQIDYNGPLDVLDIELVDGDINELFQGEGLCEYLNREGCEEDCGRDQHNSPIRVELPPGTKVTVRDVPYKVLPEDKGGGIRLWINNVATCYQCMSHFFPHDEGKGPWDV